MPNYALKTLNGSPINHVLRQCQIIGDDVNTMTSLGIIVHLIIAT